MFGAMKASTCHEGIFKRLPASFNDMCHEGTMY